jgi:hypothetical protein
MLRGDWNSGMGKLYRKEVNGAPLSQEEQLTFLPAMKAQYAGPLKTGQLLLLLL